MKMTALMMCLVLGLVSAPALAAGEDLEKCLERNGLPMHPKDCAMLRRMQAEDRAAEERHQQYRAEMFEARRQAEEARKAEEAKKAAIREAEYLNEKAAIDRQRAETERYRKQAEHDLAMEEAAQQRRCGKDYQVLRIGMKFSRFQDCSWGAVYETRTTTAQGVVDVYRGTFDYIYVKDGRIVGYTKRTQ